MSIPKNKLAEDIQRTLVARGYDLGRSGPAGDGVDGQAGDATFKAVISELTKLGPIVKGSSESILTSSRKTGFSQPDGITKFWNYVRDESGLFAPLRTSQVHGTEEKLRVYADAGWGLAFAAYGLATSYWETARTMQPIEEYGKGRGRRYGSPGKHGQIAYGRGDVQLTWDYNYERADQELELGGELTRDYSLALRPDISAKIMVGGMSHGWFTGKKLSDYLPTRGPATFEQFKQSRRIINGTDHWEEIAGIAVKFQEGLTRGGWQ